MKTRAENRITVRECCIFAVLGTVMFVSKLLMEVAANVHLIGCFTITFTLVYRRKAIIPVMLFVFLTGLFYGFDTWWFPYFYLWPLLHFCALLIPREASNTKITVLAVIIGSLHGLLYGILYAPFEALVYNLGFDGMIKWIIVGIPFDITHAVSNAAAALLVVPLVKLIKRLSER